jgi:hypothetical protein
VEKNDLVEFNPYIDCPNTVVMTKDELTWYGLRRLKVMLLMEQDMEDVFSISDTPLYRLAVETAHNHVKRCEERYGISRYDIRLQEISFS